MKSMKGMKAVIYGGGNIGRGFIAPVLRRAGYQVTFIDIDDAVVKGINSRHEYPVRLLSAEGYEDVIVDGVSAVNGNDSAAAADIIASADIMATAVGVNVLKHIAENLAMGIKKRFSETEKPLNIIICENLLDADRILGDMLKSRLTESDKRLLEERIGLVEASIGRMVPIQTDAMKDGDPLRVCVERYGFLPVDKDAFRGEVPDIRELVPYSPFGFYIQRKLFIHNMGHALCAYLGLYGGYEYIWQAIDKAEILLTVKNAMLESAGALSVEYGVPMQTLLAHIDDLLLRFTNRALGDTCARVGSDTVRKLGANDRLTGAAVLCEKHGIIPLHITIGIAAALHRHMLDSGQPQSMKAAAQTLETLSGLSTEQPLAAITLEWYSMLMKGTTPEHMLTAARKKLAAQALDII